MAWWKQKGVIMIKKHKFKGKNFVCSPIFIKKLRFWVQIFK